MSEGLFAKPSRVNAWHIYPLEGVRVEQAQGDLHEHVSPVSYARYYEQPVER